MAKISSVLLPDGVSRRDIRAGAIPFGQVDDTSTSKIFTATVPGISDLTDGVCCYLMNGVVTSESGFTLNVNNLGAKPVYSTLSAATRATTLFNVNYTLFFVYNSQRVNGGCWDAYYGYDSNTNTIGYQLRTNSSSLPVNGATYRYRLLFTSADGAHFVPANTSTSTNATASRTVNQTPIDPFGRIVYYSYTSAISSGSRPGATYLWEQYTLSLGYSFNRTGAALTLTSWKPVYIKCAPQTDGSAIMDADTPYVQALPSSDDGKIYIFLGVAYSATSIELVPQHPVYYYKDSAIRLWTNEGSSSAGVTSVGLANSTDGGLTVSGSPITTSGSITVGHTNVLSSAQATQALYPITIDKNGHISAYGTAVDPDDIYWIDIVTEDSKISVTTYTTTATPATVSAAIEAGKIPIVRFKIGESGNTNFYDYYYLNRTEDGTPQSKSVLYNYYFVNLTPSNNTISVFVLLDNGSAFGILKNTYGYSSNYHTHGNITNEGTINSTAVTPESGDYILISNADLNYGQIDRGIAVGSDTTKYLRNDGTWQTISITSSDVTTALGYTPIGKITISGVDYNITSIMKGEASGISGVYIIYDNNGDNGVVFLPDGNGFSTGSQQILTTVAQTYATKQEIPTLTSELTNDSGFITSETDPTVPAWAKESTKPTYTASEVGALATTGGQLTGDLTLYVASGNSPAIIFQRGTLTDNFNDWKIYDKSGFLYFAQRGSGSSAFGDVGYIDTSGVLHFPGSSLTNLNASNLASGTVPNARLPIDTSIADGTASTNLPTSAAVSTYVMNYVSNVISDADNIDYGNITVASALDDLYANQLPTVTSSDNGKVLRVVNGAWSAVELPSASGVSF